MSIINVWICEIALLGSGLIYAHSIEPRLENKRKLVLHVVAFLLFCSLVNRLPFTEITWLEPVARLCGFLFLIYFLHGNRKLSWNDTVYYAIWAFMSWQLLYELYLLFYNVGTMFFNMGVWSGMVGEILIYVVGYFLMSVTVGKFMPEEGRKQIGPRQLSLAVLTFLIFQLLVISPGNMERNMENQRWLTLYLTQVLLGVVLYLQNELFKKSEMRQEVEMTNLLLKKEKEMYKLSRENIELINQKAHDLKHQIHAIRSVSKNEIEKYLDEIEESIHIYDAIVKTGNEVLDTILTEKSLYCKKKGITVSCVADGSQMDFIHAVDLYAMLGNAMDNAIEAVEKFKHKEKRQIDVIIYRKQQFLAINILNPVKGNLLYEQELPVTTKEDKNYHGFGLISIKHILKRYDGVLNITEEDGCFSLMMLIPIPSSTCDN